MTLLPPLTVIRGKTYHYLVLKLICTHLLFSRPSSDSSDDSSSSSDSDDDSDDGRPSYNGQPGNCKLCRGDRYRNKENRPEPLVHCAKCKADGRFFA